jgi:hypothetical protein
MNQLETVGSLYMETQRLLAEYRKLLELFQNVKDGGTPIEAIRLDLDKLTWAIVLGSEPK